MYEKFYNIPAKAFNLNPDPDFFFKSEGHANALSHLEYTIAENKGFAVITGEVGAGKTTLINFLLYRMALDIQIGLINNTNIQPSQLMRVICDEFEIDVDGMDRAKLADRFQHFLIKKYAEGARVLLIIDEAQNLPVKSFEEIRMISNLESGKEHLIQIVLVGQPELKAKLQRGDLRQLAQRVSISYHLNGMSRDEVADYIRHRLKIANAENTDLFDQAAIDKIYTYSEGIPRLINILCDTALVYGYADGSKIINAGIVDTVIAEKEQSGILYAQNMGQLGKERSSATEKQSASAPQQNHLEQRILNLEYKVENILDRLNHLSQQNHTREKTIIDLLKMNEENLKSRMKLFRYIGRMHNDHGGPQKEANPAKKPQ